MIEYVVKIGFWLRAYDSRTIEADTDAEAIAVAKTAAAAAMESAAHPEHVEFAERREGIIAFIDRITPDGRAEIAEAVAFDDDRIHPPPAPLVLHHPDHRARPSHRGPVLRSRQG